MSSRLCSTLLLFLLIGSPASAVTMDWAFVGDPGNPADTQLMNDGTTGYGSVPYDYYIGTYEVTNAQYAEFLNAKAKSDPLALYHTSMGSSLDLGGIRRSGSSGSYTYSALAGRQNMPVNYVSFYDVLRFANWMNNGQGNGDTESGAYTLLGGTAEPTNGSTVTRNAGATIFLTSEDEWHKAAYYDAVTSSYFDFPAGSDTEIACSTPTATANHANCNFIIQDLTAVGTYTGSASPYGTFDQGGNLWEWNEAFIELIFPPRRGARGGSYSDPSEGLAAEVRQFAILPTSQFSSVGFRLAMIVPEPSTGLLVIAGMLGFASRRRKRS